MQEEEDLFNVKDITDNTMAADMVIINIQMVVGTMGKILVDITQEDNNNNITIIITKIIRISTRVKIKK